MVPQDLRYTKEHEWIRVVGDLATVGITEYAAEQLGTSYSWSCQSWVGPLPSSAP